MHKGTVRSLLTKKGENLPAKFRLKFAKEAANGMYEEFLVFSCY